MRYDVIGGVTSRKTNSSVFHHHSTSDLGCVKTKIMKHNPSSRTFKSSFHGTGISVFQLTSVGKCVTPRDITATITKPITGQLDYQKRTLWLFL